MTGDISMDRAPMDEASRLRLLTTVGEAFAVANMTIALAVVARALALQFGDGCGIHLLDGGDEAGSWHPDPLLAPHLHAVFAAQGRPGLDGLNGRVFRTSQALRLARTSPQEVRAFVPPALFPILVRHDFHSALLVPMRVPGRTIGVLTALRDRTPDGYTAADGTLLQELADYVALAATMAQLTRTAREVDQLAERERVQREAIATVSHDLRTPLSAVHVALDLLAEIAAARLDEAGKELLATARRNTRHLVIQVEDLLAINQLDAGVLALRTVRIDLRAVVDEAVRAVLPLFQSKRQVVEIALPDALPLRGDARRLEQTVINLLANAHRHTPPGTRITITGAADAGGVRLTLRDNGRGILPGDLERIFERHHRRNAGGGSGLGLAIAHAFITQHGGQLWAENAPEGGAVFQIVLPRHEEADSPRVLSR
jgi:signal transduction histidine kinase